LDRAPPPRRPKIFPFTHHDIEGDIQLGNQRMVIKAYRAW